jgi:hypothetical protein
MEFNVYYNGEEVTGILGISFFPFNFTTYDASDSLLTAFLYQAAVSVQDLPSGTAYIVFNVFGDVDYPSGTYRIEFYAY